jgi:cyclophilin family peptidyl-prolyl cis-trans isomerase
VLVQILVENPKDIRVVYRHFPLLSIHDKAAMSVQAAEAAGKQGKFWEMHDLLYETQAEWVGLTVEEFKAWLFSSAEKLSIDAQQFTQDLDSPEIKGIPQKAWEHNRSLGIPYTPFVLVNGQIWSNGLPLTYENLSTVIKLDNLEHRQFTACPPMTLNPTKQYRAILHTEKGDITIELFANKAPIAVNNFIFLSRNGWYDGVMFHRVIPGFAVQTGDPTGTGYGGPGYAFVNEISPDLKFDKPGMVGMANSGPDSNGSQLFITLAPAAHLDGKYTIFGRVVIGMNVVESLTARNPAQPGVLPPGDKINSIEIQELTSGSSVN